jgi:hypothetical protein
MASTTLAVYLPPDDDVLQWRKTASPPPSMLGPLPRLRQDRRFASNPPHLSLSPSSNLIFLALGLNPRISEN